MIQPDIIVERPTTIEIQNETFVNSAFDNLSQATYFDIISHEKELEAKSAYSTTREATLHHFIKSAKYLQRFTEYQNTKDAAYARLSYQDLFVFLHTPLRNILKSSERYHFISFQEENVVKIDSLYNANEEDIWNILFLLSEKLIRPISNRITIYSDNKYKRRTESISEMFVQNQDNDINYRINLAIFITQLLMHSDRLIVDLLSCVDSYESLSIGLSQHQPQKSMFQVTANLSPVHPVLPFYNIRYRQDAQIIQSVIVFFAVIDNCRVDRIWNIINADGFFPFLIVDVISIASRDISNDFRFADRLMYTLVIGLRKRIARFLLDRKIAFALINARSRSDQIYNPDIRILPNEIILDIFQKYVSSLPRLRMLYKIIMSLKNTIQYMITNTEFSLVTAESESIKFNFTTHRFILSRPDYLQSKLRRLNIFKSYLQDILDECHSLNIRYE